MTRRRGKHSRLHTQSVKHSRSYTTKRRRLTFRIPAHPGRFRPSAEIIVVSFDRSGSSTRITRKVRLR